MSILGLVKDYVIESEDEIPEEFRDEVEKRIMFGKNNQNKTTLPIIPGKKGEKICLIEDIGKVFIENREIYLGHGTNVSDEEVESILRVGLKVVNPKAIMGYMSTLRGLDSTTILFGEGSEKLFEEQRELLDNWPHKESKNIIIVSIPKRYAMRPCDARGGSCDFYEAFYDGSEEKGFVLRPEFIKGVYNADSHSFILNEKFYMNLPDAQREKLLEEVRKKYIKLYSENAVCDPRKAMYPLDLDEAELKELAIEWYKVQLQRFRKDKSEMNFPKKAKNVEPTVMGGEEMSSEGKDIFDDEDVW